MEGVNRMLWVELSLGGIRSMGCGMEKEEADRITC